MRARSCSGLHARVHEAVVTRTWQKHAVRCDMRTPEELHVGRLWVTKYGWREQTGVRRRAILRIRRESELDREVRKEEMR